MQNTQRLRRHNKESRDACHTVCCRLVNDDLDLIRTWRPLYFLSGFEKKNWAFGNAYSKGSCFYIFLKPTKL